MNPYPMNQMPITKYNQQLSFYQQQSIPQNQFQPQPQLQPQLQPDGPNFKIEPYIKDLDQACLGIFNRRSLIELLKKFRLPLDKDSIFILSQSIDLFFRNFIKDVIMQTKARVSKEADAQKEIVSIPKLVFMQLSAEYILSQQKAIRKPREFDGYDPFFDSLQKSTSAGLSSLHKNEQQESVLIEYPYQIRFSPSREELKNIEEENFPPLLKKEEISCMDVFIASQNSRHISNNCKLYVLKVFAQNFKTSK